MNKEIKFVTFEECQQAYPIGCVIHENGGDSYRIVNGYIYDGKGWSPAEDTWIGWRAYTLNDITIKRAMRIGPPAIKFDYELAEKYPIGTILVDERYERETVLPYHTAADLVNYRLRGYATVTPGKDNKCVVTQIIGECYKVKGYVYRMSDNQWHLAYNDSVTWLEFKNENGVWRLDR